jgi:hypothetical protein
MMVAGEWCCGQRMVTVCVCAFLLRCITVLSIGVPGLDLTPTARKLFHLEDFEPPGADIVPQQPSDKRHPFDEKVGLDKDEFNKFQDEVRVKKVLGYLGGEGVQSASCCRVCSLICPLLTSQLIVYT